MLCSSCLGAKTHFQACILTAHFMPNSWKWDVLNDWRNLLILWLPSHFCLLCFSVHSRQIFCIVEIFWINDKINNHMLSLVLIKNGNQTQSWNPVLKDECNVLTWLCQDVTQQLTPTAFTFERSLSWYCKITSQFFHWFLLH